MIDVLCTMRRSVSPIEHRMSSRHQPHGHVLAEMLPAPETDEVVAVIAEKGEWFLLFVPSTV